MTATTAHEHPGPELSCLEDHRRSTLRELGWNGIDYVEVSDDQRHLEVTLIDRAPSGLGVGNVTIEGGRRSRDLRVVDVRVERHHDPNVDDRVIVTVDRPGDFSTYRLCFVESDDRGRATDRPLAGFDPRYSCVDVDFKAGCPSDLDCAPVDDCPPEPRPNPAIDYLARDWDGLRRVLFDRLALLVPDWTERHIPDVGVALVELLAYVGDRLSYYQDAVATEAYLETARKRVSVRRHARLVDYHLHEGCNARAWVCLVVSDAIELDRSSVAFAALDASPSTTTMTWADLMATAPASREVFEPIGSGALVARPAHNRIAFYTWGGHECCLVAGATCATLVDGWVRDEGDGTGEDDCPDDDHDTPDDGSAGTAGGYGTTDVAQRGHGHGRAPHAKHHGGGGGQQGDDHESAERLLDLHPGDVLIFEEVIGPQTGLAADADPRHRHAVCLTEVVPTVDPVTDIPVVEICWNDKDALPFPLCLSTDGPPPRLRAAHRRQRRLRERGPRRSRSHGRRGSGRGAAGLDRGDVWRRLPRAAGRVHAGALSTGARGHAGHTLHESRGHVSGHRCARTGPAPCESPPRRPPGAPGRRSRARPRHRCGVARSARSARLGCGQPPPRWSRSTSAASPRSGSGTAGRVGCLQPVRTSSRPTGSGTAGRATWAPSRSTGSSPRTT